MEALKQTFQECGQGHVFEHFQSLTEKEQADLIEQAKWVDPQRLNEIFETSTKDQEPSSANGEVIEPLKDGVVSQKDIDGGKCEEWRREGLEMIAQGALGVLLLAGGQGTRLGSSKPKGCYDVGLPSGKSMFQIQAERIRRLEVMAGDTKSLRWYIMTSQATDKDTREFFEANRYFGLKKDQIVFFSQGMLPAVTEEGKIIMESKGKIAMSPDGNGGVYVALEKHGIFEDMKKHGVEALDCCSVDNILVRLGDPVFAGYCKTSGIECGARVVAKSYPEEKVGVFAQKGGKLHVVEYSELDPLEASASDPQSGVLKYNWSNICLHYFEREWLARVSSKLSKGGSYHIAKKKIPSFDTKVPGIKLELFIFDTFPMATNWGLMEVKREEEFSPVKNAPGSETDSPDTAREHVLALHESWVTRQDGIIEGEGGIEISPLVSYAGENLEWVKGRRFRAKDNITATES
ncbi:UDP-N-acetylglucosamine diphosphorylase 1 [Picochlorum sp. SENEW3]|nr:UDP-N-acetylglucosamine diphosphorylase 1 [Picochlorum sp. SENEW3]